MCLGIKCISKSSFSMPLKTLFLFPVHSLKLLLNVFYPHKAVALMFSGKAWSGQMLILLVVSPCIDTVRTD